MYQYETHLHTSPVSKCGRASVRETLEYYKSLGFSGVFITNHFLDESMAMDPSRSYEDRIRFFFSDVEEGKRLAKEIGITVLGGVEHSYKGTHFLVYGLDVDWFLAHPQIEQMGPSEQLRFFAENGALVIHAHPFREKYVDHIRLFPRCVHGVEIFNAHRTDLENSMAKIYAAKYGLRATAGSDNHSASGERLLGGVQFETPLRDEADYVERIKAGEGIPFRWFENRVRVIDPENFI